MSTKQQYLEELLERIRANLGDIPKTIETAFINTPRHLFVDKFITENKEGKIVEIEIDDNNIDQYLPEIYKDYPIGLIADNEGNIISTISQPSIVVMMISKLKIQKGLKILEIGTASGWNAALMAKLVGKIGRIYSNEIIPELTIRARSKFKTQGIENITLNDGDGAIAIYDELFDRIMFTVGSYDIPISIHKQLKENGLLLMVLKNKGLFDSLILFKKKDNHLQSIENNACKFVPLKGQYAMTELNPIRLETLTIWKNLRDKIVFEQSFWWGTKSAYKRKSNLKIMGITSFLGIVEPQFEIFKDENDDLFFGLIDYENDSIAIWKNDKLIGYGNSRAVEKIKSKFDLYLNLGMPSVNCFNLKVYPKNHKVTIGKYQWLIIRRDSQFLWSLNN